MAVALARIRMPLIYLYLRRGSIRVRRGDRVTLGQQLAECGNSGNSTEPHLHFQLMDHPSVLLAAGLPMRFRDLEGAKPDGPGLPRNLQPFTVPGLGSSSFGGPTPPSDADPLRTQVPA
jgi:murein DD-endopeptidase MepM/ murein hydrolase activator NlpD